MLWFGQAQEEGGAGSRTHSMSFQQGEATSM